MRRDPKNRTLEVCIQRLQAGENLEQVLGTYPRLSSTFRPILQAVQTAWLYAESIQSPAHHQSESREVFLETAGEMVPRRAAPQWKRRRRMGLFLIIFLLLLSLLTWQLVRLSSGALPGELLYPVKLMEEQLRLKTTTAPAKRLALEFSQDQIRSQEVETLLLHGHSRDVVFTNGLHRMEVGEWLVGDVRVLIPVDTRVLGDIRTGYDVTVYGHTNPGGVIVASQVQMREYSFEGRVEEKFVGLWNIDGVNVVVGQETILRGEPDVDNSVQVIARRDLEGELFARLIEVINP